MRALSNLQWYTKHSLNKNPCLVFGPFICGSLFYWWYVRSGSNGLHSIIPIILPQRCIVMLLLWVIMSEWIIGTKEEQQTYHCGWFQSHFPCEDGLCHGAYHIALQLPVISQSSILAGLTTIISESFLLNLRSHSQRDHHTSSSAYLIQKNIYRITFFLVSAVFFPSPEDNLIKNPIKNPVVDV